MDKGNVALAITRNPSYMTAKEVLSVRFARGTEENKEVNHTYEVVSLEANKWHHKCCRWWAGAHCIHMMCICIQTSDRWINRQDCNYMYTQELKTSNNCVALLCLCMWASML